MKILMQTRSNVFTHRGGDTVVLERLTQGLQAKGLEVDTRLEHTTDLHNYDLVHLYNFATPELTEHFAKVAFSFNVPFVVTTLYEDWPLFFNQMQLCYRALQAYVTLGQPKEKWESLEERILDCAPHPRLENQWTAQHANELLATGSAEVRALKRDYGDSIHTTIHRLGCDIEEICDGGKWFTDTFGFDNFILCVGRLETRKNQLMLLKALEFEEIPLVFVTGGFSYQPDYVHTCKGFSRAGKTLFLDRLTPLELSSTFAAAKVHVLPSWYELPGMVTLEAAALGNNVVTSDYGTARDYLGDLAIYAKPHNATDLYNAILTAYYSPINSELETLARSYTWNASVEELSKIYSQLVK